MILIYGANMPNLKFGDKIRVVWKDGDVHDGVIFGDKIGYSDGKYDSIETVRKCQDLELCKVYSM